MPEWLGRALLPWGRLRARSRSWCSWASSRGASGCTGPRAGCAWHGGRVVGERLALDLAGVGVEGAPLDAACVDVESDGGCIIRHASPSPVCGNLAGRARVDTDIIGPDPRDSQLGTTCSRGSLMFCSYRLCYLCGVDSVRAAPPPSEGGCVGRTVPVPLTATNGRVRKPRRGKLNTMGK